MAEHNIRIQREGSNVFVGVYTDLKIDKNEDKILWFKHECDNADEAELKMRYIHKRHQKQIQEIREAEFFSGWKHGKAKKHGKGWFNWFVPTLRNGSSHI